MNLEQVSEQLQRLVDGTLERGKDIHSFVLGVASAADLQWSFAAGSTGSAATAPMRVETPFFVASVTKMFTAAAVMILQERGRLALDHGISKHLPGELIRGLHHHRGRDYTDRLTIRHLIGQTSGLPDYFLERARGGRSVYERVLAEGDQVWGTEEVVRLTREAFPAKFPPPQLEDLGVNGKPGRAHYSDTNYKLLGAIVESATEKPLHIVFEDLFFDPLELHRTYLYGRPREGDTEEPARVFHKDRPLVVPQLMVSHGPEGGLVSTVDDLIRFGRALMSGALFGSAGTLEQMQQWNRIFFPLQYGYGLMRFKLPWILSPIGYSPELVGHSGSSGSFLFHCRELDLYMAGTLNQMTLMRAPFALMIQVARILERARR